MRVYYDAFVCVYFKSLSFAYRKYQFCIAMFKYKASVSSVLYILELPKRKLTIKIVGKNNDGVYIFLFAYTYVNLNLQEFKIYARALEISSRGNRPTLVCFILQFLFLFLLLVILLGYGLILGLNTFKSGLEMHVVCKQMVCITLMLFTQYRPMSSYYLGVNMILTLFFLSCRQIQGRFFFFFCRYTLFIFSLSNL